ncbi:hypothetical protein LINGRAHAP2_LOCUS29055 [Linum grandiflorum]
MSEKQSLRSTTKATAFVCAFLFKEASSRRIYPLVMFMAKELHKGLLFSAMVMLNICCFCH